MILKGEIRNVRSDTCPSATSFATYQILTALQSNTDFHIDRPATFLCYNLY